MNAHRPKENKEYNRFLFDFPRTLLLFWISNDLPNILSPVGDVILKHIVYISLNAHIFAICKDNLFKFSVIVHNSLVFHSVKISHF